MTYEIKNKPKFITIPLKKSVLTVQPQKKKQNVTFLYGRRDKIRGI